MRIKLIKNTNDAIIGLVLFALGTYILLTDKIIFGSVVEMSGGPLVRPDVYVRLIGGVLAVLAAVLVLKSLNWERGAEVVPFRFILTPHILLTVLALVVYTFILTRAGFAVSTFLLNFFLTSLFLHRERWGEGLASLGKKDIVRSLIRVTIYSVVLVILIYILFTKVLYVDLP